MTSSRLNHGGLEALLDKAASADPKCVEQSTGTPSILLNRVFEARDEVTFAAGACKKALLRLIPLQLLGREALSQLH